ncbi:Zinc knuckle CX2CX4HX4C [Sesbania bispinosa]|nr:Zinc knuckle CX2CX4HX4C [Sesbania bispinosa]
MRRWTLIEFCGVPHGYSVILERHKWDEKLDRAWVRSGNLKFFETKDRGTFIKVSVDFDTNKPLIPGVNIGSRVDGIIWVDFRFERLPQFCYACGLIGHEEESCKSHNTNATNSEKEDHDIGPWLRASVFGRKLTKSHKGDPPSSDGRTQSNKQQMPKEFLDMLSSLSVSNDSCPKEKPQEVADSVLNVEKSDFVGNIIPQQLVDVPSVPITIPSLATCNSPPVKRSPLKPKSTCQGSKQRTWKRMDQNSHEAANKENITHAECVSKRKALEYMFSETQLMNENPKK